MTRDLLKKTGPAGLLAIVAMAGCGPSGAGQGDGSGFTGEVAIDGSSTVTPIMIAVAEEFSIENPGADVTVGTSGTGGGMKKFCAGETQISMASRPIKSTEIEACDASDGLFVLQVGREHQFEKLAEIIGHPEWLQDERFATREGWAEHSDTVIRAAVEDLLGRDRLAAFFAGVGDGEQAGHELGRSFRRRSFSVGPVGFRVGAVAFAGQAAGLDGDRC